jgi:cytochrome P450
MGTTYDLESDAYFAHPYDTYASMRRDDPVYWHEPNHMWYVSRYDDVVTVCRDRRFSSAMLDGFFAGISPGLEEKDRVYRFFSNWVVCNDAPEHTRLRGLLARAFVPANIRTLAPLIHEIVNAHAERIRGASEFDAFKDFSQPVAGQVIARVLGVSPGDQAVFQGWSNDVFRFISRVSDRNDDVLAADKAIANLEQYFRDAIAERRNRPVTDLLGALVQAEEDGRILSDQELVSTCAQLLIAAQEASAKLIGNAILVLLRNPEHLAILRANPHMAGSAIDESLRFESPTAVIRRIVTKDVEIAGQLIPAGAVVMGLPPSANRDPAAFDDPDHFRMDRAKKLNFGFGYGPHMCIGAALARMEAVIALDKLLAVFPELDLVAEPAWFKGNSTRGVISLPVRA